MAGLIEGVVGRSGGGTTDRRVGAVKRVNGTGTKDRKVDTSPPLDPPPYPPPRFPGLGPSRQSTEGQTTGGFRPTTCAMVPLSFTKLSGLVPGAGRGPSEKLVV